MKAKLDEEQRKDTWKNFEALLRQFEQEFEGQDDDGSEASSENGSEATHQKVMPENQPQMSANHVKPPMAEEDTR